MLKGKPRRFRRNVKELLTLKKFSDYLLGLKPRAKAGVIGDCEKCPIAQYLTHLGFSGIEVYGHMHTQLTNRGLSSVPVVSVSYRLKSGQFKRTIVRSTWGKKFIEKVDDFDNADSKYITVSRARKILEEVTK